MTLLLETANEDVFSLSLKYEFGLMKLPPQLENGSYLSPPSLLPPPNLILSYLASYSILICTLALSRYVLSLLSMLGFKADSHQIVV